LGDFSLKLNRRNKMKSNEHVKQLIKLSEENPELEIIAKVESECVPNDDNGWWGARIGESNIEEYWIPGEVYLFEDDIGDLIINEYCSELAELPNIAEKKRFISDKYETMIESGDIKKAIFVTIKP
jgi:hypothetical protein